MSNIAYPPDNIFKFRQNRQNPSEIKKQEGNVGFITKAMIYDEKGEYKYGKGIFMEYEDVPFPSKGHVIPEAVYATGQVKRLLISSIKFIAGREMIFPLIGFIFTNKAKVIDRFITTFIDIVDINILKPYYLKSDYYSAAAKELRTFLRESIKSFGVDHNKSDLFGEIICMLFQYDNAYYYRLIDIMSETSQEEMLNDFPKEIDKLAKILIERDPNIHQLKKYDAIHKLVRVLYIIPSFRKAIKAGIKAVNFKGWQMDEADIYHTNLYDGYNMRGLTFNERFKEYCDFHGGKENTPPRIHWWYEGGEIKTEIIKFTA